MTTPSVTDAVRAVIARALMKHDNHGYTSSSALVTKLMPEIAPLLEAAEAMRQELPDDILPGGSSVSAQRFDAALAKLRGSDEHV